MVFRYGVARLRRFLWTRVPCHGLEFVASGFFGIMTRVACPRLEGRWVYSQMLTWSSECRFVRRRLRFGSCCPRCVIWSAGLTASGISLRAASEGCPSLGEAWGSGGLWMTWGCIFAFFSLALFCPVAVTFRPFFLVR
jgi:hypothetical protein